MGNGSSLDSQSTSAWKDRVGRRQGRRHVDEDYFRCKILNSHSPVTQTGKTITTVLDEHRSQVLTVTRDPRSWTPEEITLSMMNLLILQDKQLLNSSSVETVVRPPGENTHTRASKPKTMNMESSFAKRRYFENGSSCIRKISKTSISENIRLPPLTGHGKTTSAANFTDKSEARKFTDLAKGFSLDMDCTTNKLPSIRRKYSDVLDVFNFSKLKIKSSRASTNLKDFANRTSSKHQKRSKSRFTVIKTLKSLAKSNPKVKDSVKSKNSSIPDIVSSNVFQAEGKCFMQNEFVVAHVEAMTAPKVPKGHGHKVIDDGDETSSDKDSSEKNSVINSVGDDKATTASDYLNASSDKDNNQSSRGSHKNKDFQLFGSQSSERSDDEKEPTGSSPITLENAGDARPALGQNSEGKRGTVVQAPRFGPTPSDGPQPIKSAMMQPKSVKDLFKPKPVLPHPTVSFPKEAVHQSGTNASSKPPPKEPIGQSKSLNAEPFPLGARADHPASQLWKNVPKHAFKTLPASKAAVSHDQMSKLYVNPAMTNMIVKQGGKPDQSKFKQSGVKVKPNGLTSKTNKTNSDSLESEENSPDIYTSSDYSPESGSNTSPNDRKGGRRYPRKKPPPPPPVFISSSYGSGSSGSKSKNAGDRLKNVDIIEELTYCTPGATTCCCCETYNCCNDCGKCQLIPNSCECCCNSNPIKYCRRQRFNFEDESKKRDEDSPPFCWECRDNPYDDIPCGKNPKPGDCKPINKPRNCNDIFPSESGTYFYDACRGMFIPVEEIKTENNLPPEIIDEIIEEEPVLTNIEPIMQPVLNQCGPCGPGGPPGGIPTGPPPMPFCGVIGPCKESEFQNPGNPALMGLCGANLPGLAPMGPYGAIAMPQYQYQPPPAPPQQPQNPNRPGPPIPPYCPCPPCQPPCFGPFCCPGYPGFPAFPPGTTKKKKSKKKSTHVSQPNKTSYPDEESGSSSYYNKEVSEEGG